MDYHEVKGGCVVFYASVETQKKEVDKGYIVRGGQGGCKDVIGKKNQQDEMKQKAKKKAKEAINALQP